MVNSATLCDFVWFYIMKREDVKRDVTSLDHFHVLRFTSHAK